MAPPTRPHSKIRLATITIRARAPPSIRDLPIRLVHFRRDKTAQATLARVVAIRARVHPMIVANLLDIIRHGTPHQGLVPRTQPLSQTLGINRGSARPRDPPTNGRHLSASPATVATVRDIRTAYKIPRWLAASWITVLVT